VSPDDGDEYKQIEGTYRYDHAEWRDVAESQNPFSVRGNRGGTVKRTSAYYLCIPPVVQVCRKVSATGTQSFEIYVPIPKDPAADKKGWIINLNSKAKLQDLVYNVGDMAMFMAAAEFGDVNLVKEWHSNTESRVHDLDKAVKRLDYYVMSRGDQEPAHTVDVYGPASEAAVREQEARDAERERKMAERVQLKTVRATSAFDIAHVQLKDPGSEEETDVSVPALTGAARAAAHPSVSHITETLLRMGYLEDLHEGVYLLSDPLGNEVMGRRNKVARHIKSKDDAEEAMMVLCWEGRLPAEGFNLQGFKRFVQSASFQRG
jgi:hypothetical protein